MSPEAQSYLDRLEAGSLDLEHPELLEAAGRLPDLAEALDELRAVEALLGVSATEAQEVIAAAHGAPARGRDREQVERAMAEGGRADAGRRGDSGALETGGPGSRRSWRPWLGLAALALLSFGLWSRFSAGPEPYDPGPALGGAKEARLVHPKGATSDWGRFEWQAETGPGLWFEVYVRSPKTGSKFHSEELGETQWETDRTEEMDELEWFVRSYRDSSDRYRDSPVWLASRLP